MSTKAASVTQICNRALQLLGQEQITSIDESTKRAKECAVCYEPARDRCLEQHLWKFAIKLASLAADSPVPAFGRANSFTLPTDYLMMARDYEEAVTEKDFEVENGRIVTNDTAPLQIRYVARIENPILMPPTFRELISNEMAFDMCEALTQSNVKKAALERALPKAWAAAKKANSRQGQPIDTPLGSWVTNRW